MKGKNSRIFQGPKIAVRGSGVQGWSPQKLS